MRRVMRTPVLPLCIFFFYRTCLAADNASLPRPWRRSVPITLKGVSAPSASPISAAVIAAVSSTGVARAALASAGLPGGGSMRAAQPSVTLTMGISLFLTSKDAGSEAVGSAVVGLLQSGSRIVSNALDENEVPPEEITVHHGAEAFAEIGEPSPPRPPLPPLPPLAPTGCAAAPCFPGATCIQLSAVEAARLQTEHVCGACPRGLQGDGVQCEDVDECAASPPPCDPETSCSNTFGGFQCSACPAGWRGSGVTGCTRESTCSIDNGGCDSHVRGSSPCVTILERVKLLNFLGFRVLWPTPACLTSDGLCQHNTGVMHEHTRQRRGHEIGLRAMPALLQWHRRHALYRQ